MLDMFTIAVWYVVHGSYIASILKSDCNMTLEFDFEDQDHILLPINKYIYIYLHTYQNQLPMTSL